VTRRALEVLCDFDGTIAAVDTVDLLLETLADARWRTLEDAWVRGEIDSRACMAGQVALVRGGWPAVERVLADVELDPTFTPFVAWCRAAGIALRVASEGIDRVITHLLARNRIVVDDVWASSLVEEVGGRLALRFPATRRTHCGASFCKCTLFPRRGRRPIRVLVGDGRSDFCAAKYADMVFASSKLAIHCQQHDIPFVPFDDFAAVARALRERLPRLTSAVEPAWQAS